MTVGRVLTKLFWAVMYVLFIAAVALLAYAVSHMLSDPLSPY